MSYTFPQPPLSYGKGGRALKGATSMESFVDFGFPNAEQRPPNHRKGFSSPLHLFRNRKKSTGDGHENLHFRKLSTVRSVDSVEQDSFKASRSRALPPLPRSEPASASQAALTPPFSGGPQGIYASLRMSPDLNYQLISSQPQAQSSPSYYEGLPNSYESGQPLQANPSIAYPSPPPQPRNNFDAAFQVEGQSVIDESRMLDRDVAPALFVAEGIRIDTSHPHHKQSIEVMSGATHLKEAEEALDQFTASPVWTEGKVIAQTLLEPAKDVVQLFDALTPLVPMFIVARSVFVLIVQKELDQRQNDKNIGVVVYTIASDFFKVASSESYPALDQILNFHELAHKVVEKMNEFGNFQKCVSGLITKRELHTMKSGTYKTQITGFIDAFKDFQSQLQQLLNQVSALTINTVNKKSDELNAKLDMVIAAINTLSPVEARVQAKIHDYGGEEKAFRSSPFLNEITESEFGVKITPQLKSILREDLASQLESNEAMFKLQLSATQRDLELTMQRNTDAILSKLDSGPHELIRNEDVRQIWKDMNWRLSCKTHHFVDALHHYYVQKFSHHRKTTGEVHEDQWTLKFTGRIIFQPTIGDAIDSDASGYVSTDEVNHFTAHLPENWSLAVFMAHAAAGWYQSALDCRERCLDALQKIEHYAKQMLPPNRKHLRPYFQNGCLPEIWYIVDSLNTDTFKYQQEDMQFQFEKLASYRREFLRRTYDPKMFEQLLVPHDAKGYGIFVNWHTHFRSPNVEELRRLRSSVRTRNMKREEAKARERYGNLSQRARSKRLSRLDRSAPKSPTIRIETDPQKFLDPSSAASPIRHKSSYDLEFEETDGVLHAMSAHDGSASADSDSELPDIAYTKGKIPTLDDRIRSVEDELKSMKNMLSQLLAISKPQSC
ncbi:hypothetical protein DFJ43DRAFT_1043097 [Lentinula guzmanii]|uniref:EF-hand domain-containing protein n=1 Tax=Lentinula guzmanii TaxID=2804957 RepID=A0AA38MW89_9AGAR|nr:hypothetical protein DFJ43DRAFT_1043097 [Lentinula guzmanii]